MRADRLLSMMFLLNARGRMTAQELATELEVSERTIYRDVDALSIAGVPVYTQSGSNGGISLDDHYRISLTGLSKPELLTLFAASDSGALADLGLGRSAEDALLKLFAALPGIHRREVEGMRQRIFIDPNNWFQITEPVDHLPLLQQAVMEDRRVTITYQPYQLQGTQSEQKTVDALALVAKANIWYLVGRKPNGDLRNYRVNRVQAVELTNTRFIRPADFDLPTYWKASCQHFEQVMQAENPPYLFTVRVHPSLYWVFPATMQGRYETLTAQDADGWMTVRVSCESIDEARMRVLGLGTYCEVIAPDELHETVIATARALIQREENTSYK